MDPPAIGLAAALGVRSLQVHRRPRVAILPTGDELVPPGRPLPKGAIRESNGQALAAAVREAGGEPLLLAPARDLRSSLRRALRRARGADVLLTVGGVSVGARDLVRGALLDAGARLSFWKVAVQPGKPFTFGTWGPTLVFGLPGNPASAFVAFELFVRPALRSLCGLQGDGRVHLFARLARAQLKGAARTLCLRVHLEAVRGAGLPWATPLPSQRSGDLSSLAGADALALLSAGRTRYRRGARVPVVLFRPPSAPAPLRHAP
jgi:molybdopterin molybdotransferase